MIKRKMETKTDTRNEGREERMSGWIGGRRLRDIGCWISGCEMDELKNGE